MKRYRLYVTNSKGEHTLFLKLMETLQTAKKYYTEAIAKGWASPIILAEEDTTSCEFKIKYQVNGEWKSTKSFDLMSDNALKYMLYYHSAHMEDYAKSYAKSLEDLGSGENIIDWIFNHGNQERFVLWLYDQGYLE